MPDDHTALPERLLQTLDDPALGAISSLRLRLILLLYVEQLLEPAKVRSVLEGMPDLVFERAMIYGRVGQHAMLKEAVLIVCFRSACTAKHSQHWSSTVKMYIQQKSLVCSMVVRFPMLQPEVSQTASIYLPTDSDQLKTKKRRLQMHQPKVI